VIASGNGRLITGQNPESATNTGDKVIEILKEDKQRYSPGRLEYTLLAVQIDSNNFKMNSLIFIQTHHKALRRLTLGASKRIFLEITLAIARGISYNSSRSSADSLFCGVVCNLLNNLFTSLLWIS
jgi:hypothetical protein